MKLPNTNKITALLFCLLFTSLANAATPECKMRTDLVGPCFTVNGTLSLYNGTPSARILVRNSKRILGVKPMYENDNETFVAPDWIRARVDFGKDLQSTFLVCPLEKQKPHTMQEVCIESGRTEP